MALTQTQVSKLYVAIFNRASEGGGNAWWQNNYDDMAVAADAMLGTEDALEYFGDSLDSDQAFIEHIYLNTLNKTVEDDEGGIAFWVGLLEEGYTRGEVVAALVDAVESYGPEGENYDPDDDVTNAAYNQFMNRVAVSNYMADNVEDLPENYKEATGFAFDLTVTDDAATVDSAKEYIDELAEEPPVPVEPGELFILTEGADRLEGTDRDDIFEAYTGVNMLGNDTNTLNSADILDGNAGRDQLWADIFMGSSNIMTAPRPIEPRTQEIEEMYFNAREAFMDALVTGPIQAIEGGVMDFLPDQWQVVTVNGRKMLDVDYIESNYSDVDLKVLGLTTNQSDGGTTDLADMTISMDHTSGSTAYTQSILDKDVDDSFKGEFGREIDGNDSFDDIWYEYNDKLGYGYYINGALKPSSMKVLFEQNYLIPGQEFESQAIYYLLDEDADLFDIDEDEDGIVDLLANIDVNGLQYTVNGGPAQQLEFADDMLETINDHEDFVAALQPALAQAIADGLLPADTTLTVDYTLLDFTFLDDGSRSRDIPAIVLETKTDNILNSVGFTRAEDLIGEYDVYGRLDRDADTADEPLIINIELEKVGRGADGGGMIVGGDNYTKGFDQFDVYVKGIKEGYVDQSSSLAYLLTTPHDGLETMNIYTHEDFEDNPADLTIGNSNTPVYSILDVNHLDATEFMGVLEVYYAVIQASGNYLYQLSDQGDTFQIFVTNDALNTTDSSLTIDAGTGDNTVHVDYLYSNGTVNDAVDGKLPDSDEVNTKIVTYGGDDVVVLSNMGLEMEGEFRTGLWGSGDDDEDQDGSGDQGNLLISRADGARIETGSGNDAIFLNSHLDFCSPDAALWHTLNWLGTGAEEWFTSQGITNLPPWFTEANWAPAGNVFPVFGSSLRVTFSGVESDWITIDTNNDYKTTRAELVAAIAKAIETDVNLNHVLSVDVDPSTGGISIQALTGGIFEEGDLFVDIEGPLPALSDYGFGDGYDPVPGDFFPYFPGTGDVNQMTAQQLVAAWQAYYPGSDVAYNAGNDTVTNKAGTGAPVFDSDDNSDWFDGVTDLEDFLTAVQANAEMTENLINAALYNQAWPANHLLDNDGSPASAGVQYVNAGPGHDTIVLPSYGITTVEFTGKFDTTTIISDNTFVNLRLDFDSYLDTVSASRGASINPTLDLDAANTNKVMNGFCPIPVVSFLELDGVEDGFNWNDVGGGQHNSITYFEFSDLWQGLVDAGPAGEDVLGNGVLAPTDSFASFGAAELQSALNYWLAEGGEVRLPADYFDRNLATNLNFDAGQHVDVLGAKFVILVGKDGEVLQTYEDGADDYPDAYDDWLIDNGYANGEVKVFTGQIGRTLDADSEFAQSDDYVYHFANVELQGVINLGVADVNPENRGFNWAENVSVTDLFTV